MAGLDDGLNRNWLQQVRASRLLGRPLTPEERKEVAEHGLNLPWLRPLLPALEPRGDEENETYKYADGEDSDDDSR